MFCRVNSRGRIVFDYISLRSYVGMSHLAINAPVEHTICLAMMRDAHLPAASATNFSVFAVDSKFGC